MPPSRNGECSCCLMKGRFSSIFSKPIWSTDGASYKDMLCDSLGLEFQGEVKTYVICTSCSVRVKHIYSFRKQVLTANLAVSKAFENYAVRKDNEKVTEENDKVTEENDIVTKDNDIVNEENGKVSNENKLFDVIGEVINNDEMCSDDPVTNNFDSEEEESSDLDDNIPLNTIPQAKNPNSQHGDKEISSDSSKNRQTEYLRPISETIGTEEVPKEKIKKRRRCDDSEGSYCIKCDILFETKALKHKHYLNSHYYTCTICGVRLLGKHITKHRRTVHGMKCNLCSAVFTSVALRYRHMSEVHKQWVKCSLCDHKTFSGVSLKRHMITHNKSKSHQCRFCEKKFLRKYALWIHECIHTGEKRCLCKFCGERFVQQASLKYHMEKHHPGQQ